MGLQTQLISLNLSLLVVVAALFGLQGCDGRDKAIRHKTDVWQAHKAESNPRSQKAFFMGQNGPIPPFLEIFSKKTLFRK